MTAFSNIAPQAVLPLGAYKLDDLQRGAERADQRVLTADLAAVSDKAGVMSELGKQFPLPQHYGQNLDALYDCLTDVKPNKDADQPGIAVILQNIPEGKGFTSEQRAGLLDVFRDAADYFFDKDVAFRVFYSVKHH